MDSALAWLLAWTANNIGVTLLNKAAFSKVDFPYPFFLSFVHMCCNSVGAAMVFRRMDSERAKAKDSDEGAGGGERGGGGGGHGGGGGTDTSLLGRINRRDLDGNGRWKIRAFSLVFSLNIAVGNVSLRHVSVNFNQVLRSLVPALTILMGWALGRSASRRRVLAVVPIIAGVAMACFGDMSYSALGFLVTVGCVVLAALKVVASGELLTGRLRLHPVDLLGHMAPLAMWQCLFFSAMAGELTSIVARWRNELSPAANPYPIAVVLVSGICSFSLNICSLMANKLTSPLTLCIAANVKQVLMILLSTALFQVEISALNGVGIAVVLLGSARYSYVSVLEKQQQQARLRQKKPTPAKSPAPNGEGIPLVNMETSSAERRPKVGSRDPSLVRDLEMGEGAGKM